MTHTTNYQLNQWAKADRIMMDDFNADNQKIDAAIKANADAIPKIATGSYVGTGSYGANNPNTLTFDFTPKLVLLYCNSMYSRGIVALVRGEAKYVSRFGSQNCTTLHLSWTDNSVSWYSDDGANQQFNYDDGADNYRYVYVAIG